MTGDCSGWQRCAGILQRKRRQIIIIIIIIIINVIYVVQI